MALPSLGSFTPEAVGKIIREEYDDCFGPGPEVDRMVERIMELRMQDCGHPRWGEGPHCSQMFCPNYIEKHR